ncbi:MAG: amidase [Pseudonocardia sp.]|uniref:amidase n=1 Tax=unclassified Pseudonocardia TaxID=2619320 RepID=UPI0008692735|nr:MULTISPECIES: amidase [unclassified Pseudonocardia]MBN9113071.1 amidase [Pseudonocardia sp.]ODU21662.1 MAG: amidase [Pseudonocardia sp. SCN 72-51]ODV05540.1 MAG: amidase [Pseudonocardia sp. SCN 73-27]
MDYTEYRRHDAVGLAALVAKGEVSASELLETAIARTEEVEPRIRALVRPMYEIARARAAGPLSGPFAGVPFLIKDLGQHYAGLPTGAGSRSLASYPRPVHATVVRRWLDAGLVPFGKTNTPEFGAKAITEPDANGPSRNPWDTGRTPGGSSGGSAAAVAAGVVPVAGASDGGGSIRIPAACCGLFGLKPGRGLLPDGPDVAERLHGAAVNGVVSRTVRDTAAMLDVLAGPDPGGPYPAARPAEPFADQARRDPGGLRIGFSTASPLGTPVDPQAVAAVEDAAGLLEAAGHTVEAASSGVDERQLAKDFLTMWFAAVAAQVSETRALTGCGPEAFELDTQVMAAVGRATSAPTYIAAHGRWNDHTRRLAAFHERYDLLLTPTLARPPVRIGELAAPEAIQRASRVLLRAHAAGLLARTNVLDTLIDQNLSPVPYTQLANITGRPAMSVPLYRTPDGLPLGVQFVGPLGGEGRLLALATQLEAARPWADREPPL